MKKLINFWIEEELIEEMVNTVKNSNNIYKDRTQFMTLAIQEKIQNDKKIME